MRLVSKLAEERIKTALETGNRVASPRPLLRGTPMIVAHTDVVGSLLRPPELLKARRRGRRGQK